MNKEPVTNNKTTTYLTQTQYYDNTTWIDRFSFIDINAAKQDLKWAKDFAKKGGVIKHKYRLIRREITTQEFEEDE